MNTHSSTCVPWLWWRSRILLFSQVSCRWCCCCCGHGGDNDNHDDAADDNDDAPDLAQLPTSSNSCPAIASTPSVTPSHWKLTVLTAIHSYLHDTQQAIAPSVARWTP